MKFFTVIFLCILAGAEVDLFVPSFPELSKKFNLNPFLMQLSLSVNFCAYCISSLLVGNLGDRYNRRITLLFGLTAFILGSICCVSAHNYEMLLLGRLFQGIGAAAPAILAYIIIADEYSISEQQHKMGIINGITCIAMAGAPVLGSYINIYFDWRGNFIVLLILGILSFALCYLFIPAGASNKDVKISLSSYLPLFKSNKLNLYLLAIGFVIAPYWIFIGISSILYMEDLGVSLSEFGFYQGALAATFSVFSIISPYLFKKIALKTLFYGSCILSMISALSILVLGFFNPSPLAITLCCMTLSASVVVPINILYPRCIEIIPNAKGRIAGIISALKLILTSIGLSIVSFFYQHNFLNIAITMFVCMVIFAVAICYIIKYDWLDLDDC